VFIVVQCIGSMQLLLLLLRRRYTGLHSTLPARFKSCPQCDTGS